MTAARRVVLLVGAPRSGVSSLAAALRERMPEVAITEAGDVAEGDRPAVVVVVASAVAPMTESDCATADVVASRVDAVVGVVAKIDAHRGWRGVLELCASRYGAITWLGVAAAPDVGEPKLDCLVAALRERLGDPAPKRRNELRSSEFGERRARSSRVGRLRVRRTALVRECRSVRTGRAMTMRGGLHAERVRHGQFVRQRCVGLRSEFRAAAAEVSRGSTDRFEAALAREFEGVLAELDERIGEGLGELAAALGVASTSAVEPVVAPRLPGPPATSAGAESRLTVALGAGFGLGVAMAVSRLLAGLAPGLTLAAVVVGGLAGCALTAWLVMTRALLQHRAALDRWVTEVVATLRWHAEDVIAGALLTAEADFTAELAARDDAESVALAERVGAIDDEIRSLTRSSAHHEEKGR